MAQNIDYTGLLEAVETEAAEVAAPKTSPIHRRQAVDTPPAARPAAPEKWRPGRRKILPKKKDRIATAASMAAGVLVALLIAGVAVYAAAPLRKEAPRPAPVAEAPPPTTAPKAMTDRLPPAPQGGSPELGEPKRVKTFPVKPEAMAPAPQEEEPPRVFGPAPLQEPKPEPTAEAPAEPEQEVAKAPRLPAPPVVQVKPALKAEAPRPAVKPGTVIDRIPVKLERKGPVECTIVELAQPKGKMMKVQETWKICGSTQILGKTWQVCEASTRKLYALEGVQLKRNGLVATAVTNLGSCK